MYTSAISNYNVNVKVAYTLTFNLLAVKTYSTFKNSA